MFDSSNSPPMRVLMLINLFMPEVFAGGEQQCLRLSRALAARGLRPHVLTSRSNLATPADEIMDGVPVTRIWSPVQPQMGGRHLAASFSWMRKVSHWIDSHRSEIDLIHCHHAKLNAWVGVRSARRIGVPSIVKPGSAGPNFDFLSLEKKKFLYGTIAARRIKRDANAFVGISEEMMNDLEAYGIDQHRRVLIPNGVEVPRRAPAERASTSALIRARIGATPDERIAIFSGRMERQKNVETLLRAFARSLQRGATGKLVLLGDGAQFEEQQRIAAELGLGDHAIFTGRVENVHEYLIAADLLVLPALAEGMSNAVLEAMAEGVPQIASEVSGNTDLIQHGETGWLYGSPLDVDALASALTEAFSCPKDRLQTMGAAALRRARATFAIDVIAERYLDLYLSLLRRVAAHESLR